MYSQLELCRAVTNKNLFIDINRFLGVMEYASNTVAYGMVRHARVENSITYRAIEGVDGVIHSLPSSSRLMFFRHMSIALLSELDITSVGSPLDEHSLSTGDP
jgi:outer membrane receptor for Fe3+-dicitrate